MQFNPTLAEIIPTLTPQWHVIRCQPGRENFTAKHLAARRFGIYVPLQDFWIGNHRVGESVDRQTALFPGYLFVFVWGLAQHYARIRDCPGVTGFLVDPDGAPIVVDDRIIKQMQDIEWKEWLVNLPRSLFRRRRRGEVFEIRRWQSPNHGFANDFTRTLHRAMRI